MSAPTQQEPDDTPEARERLIAELMSVELGDHDECCDRHPRCLTCPFLFDPDEEFA